MDLQNRIYALTELGDFMNSSNPSWLDAKSRTYQHNAWFIPEFIELAVQNIVRFYLNPDLLKSWAESYNLPDYPRQSKNVGIIMAGNIPLVGFHDFLSCFLSGHKQTIKLSSKDPFLLPAMIHFLGERYPDVRRLLQTESMLRGMDAYIATGSSNSARYFEYYFGKYPSVIRKNKTSIAILDGGESKKDLEKLSDDIFQFFGLGCRNVTKIFVPRNYDFIPLLEAFEKYSWVKDHNKYKNNFDYRLSLAILNKSYYMTNNSILLLENPSDFSPISVLHYEYYDEARPTISVEENENLQVIVDRHLFGTTQQPRLNDYADGVDTLNFLQNL